MEIGIASISFDRIPTELLMKIFDLLPANCESYNFDVSSLLK